VYNTFHLLLGLTNTWNLSGATNTWKKDLKQETWTMGYSYSWERQWQQHKTESCSTEHDNAWVKSVQCRDSILFVISLQTTLYAVASQSVQLVMAETSPCSLISLQSTS